MNAHTSGEDLSSIERGLTRLFPEIAVAPLQKLETGFGSIAVETGDGVIFRIARHARAAQGHAREARLLPVLRSKVPLAVPDPQWRIEPGSSDFAYGAIGYRKIAGRRLSAEWLAQSNAEKIATDMAAFLVALRGFPVERAEEVGLARADGDGGTFAALRVAVLPRLRELLTAQEYETVRRWANDFLEDVEMTRFVPRLRHGDLWYGNVLADESRGCLVAVLDWENAALGDPAWDLARQLHLGSSFAELVLRAYEALGGPTGRNLRHRMRRRWELLEFAGVRTAVELGDPDELEETIGKLRAGPILAPE